MNFIHDIWMFLVYYPQLNAIQFFYNLTQDTGYAIIIVTILVNLPLWPIMAQTYLYGQKMRYLQPKIKILQEENKENPAELMKKMGEFNKEHKLDGSSMFKMLIFQLFFVSGLYTVMRSIGEPTNPVGLYQSIFKTNISNISHKAFGGLVDISVPSTTYPIFIIISFVFTFALGWYTFKVLPKIPMAIPKDETDEKKNQRETMEKSSEFIGIWLSPIMILGFNVLLPTGVNIYTAVIAVLALVRQYIISNRYRTHVKEMIENALQTDPMISNKEILDVENLIEVESSPVSDGTVEPKKSKGKPKKNRR